VEARGDEEAAAAMLAAALDTEPDSPDALAALAGVRGRRAAATAALAAAAFDTGAAAAAAEAGEAAAAAAEAAAGEQRAAEDALRACLSVNPAHAAAVRDLGWALERSGR
jgi:hypothetical protein